MTPDIVENTAEKTETKELTKRLISSAVAAAGQRHTYRDTKVTGLELRVSGPGARRREGGKVWSLRYRYKAGQKRMAIGTCPPVGLASARRLAAVAKSMAARGEDPQLARNQKAGERQRRREAQASRLTVETMLRDYAARGVGGSSADHKTAVARWFDNYVFSEIGSKFVDEVHGGEIHSLVTKVALEKGATANRVLSSLKAAWKWAMVAHGLQVKSNPASAVPMPYDERANIGRALDNDELPHAWKASEQLPAPFRDAFKLLLLTGQRREEVSELRLSAVNLETGVWKQTKWENKAGRRHHITFPATALAILRRIADEQAERMKGDDRFFVQENGNGIDSAWGGYMKKLRKWADEGAKRKLEPWKLHSLRHTVRTGLSGEVPEHVAELVLNHAIKDELARRYGHASFLEEIGAALATWERHLLAIVEPAERKVVSLRG